ncbi:MarR family transcriptional regulator [Jatrophihabitans sp.]|uniref:MarR family winged helix-turn-helix transcriptional regulator n=1 Tax=Jatrophihabitans sp. TaxID=1932789 RepID=UPI0030C70B8E|nr:transcriptional regulator, MarR family [Jatrophihabitans sp.]
MTSDRPNAPQDESLGESFWALARQLRRASLDSLAEWDVTPSQARVLRVLARRDGLRLSDLAEHLRIAARSTTEVVDGLEAKGLVRRSPDPNDRRATLVSLTEQGAALCGQLRASRGSGAELVFDRLSATDRAHLARILRRLRED